MNINNNTDHDLDEFIEVVKKFLPFAQKQIGFNRPPTINLISDSENAADPMGKTAFYNPELLEIAVYTDNRHPKDMLRSLSHELVHHSQNCDGKLNNVEVGEDGERTNGVLREMEVDANSRGNMCVRDFVDQKLHLEESKRRNKTMVNEEEQLREAIRKLILENMEQEEVYDRDDELGMGEEVEEIEIEAEGDAGYSLGPDATPEEMLALVARFVEEQGIETAPPGMTDAGIAATKNYLKGDFAPRNANAAAAANQAQKDAEMSESVELRVEELKNILSEARKRRRRRAARIAAQKSAPVVPTAPVAVEKLKTVKKAPAQKKVLAKKEVNAKPVKEWYGEELFGKLLKEAIK